MGNAWGDHAARYLLDDRICPRCERGPVGADRCPFCGAALEGDLIEELREISAAAAGLLQDRQKLIGRLVTVEPPTLPAPPLAPPPATVPAGAPTLAPPTGPPRDTTPPPTPRESHVSVQSVLAVAGAALVAIAALVFAYLTPDITPAMRNVVIVIVTVIFGAGAWWLASRGIRFSAEAVGALGMVFLALDVAAVVEAVPQVNPWTAGAAGTLVASLLLLGGALLVRLRAWLWLAAVGLTLTPMLFGLGFDEPWPTIAGFLVAGYVSFGVHVLLDRVAARFGGPLAADHVSATALRLAAVVITVILLVTLLEPSPTLRALGSAATIAAIALLAGLSTRRHLPRLWSAVAGAALVLAVAILPLALDLPDGDAYWYLTLVPAAAGLGLAMTATLPTGATLRSPAWHTGGLVVAVLAAVPPVLVAGGHALGLIIRLISIRTSSAPEPSPWIPAGESMPFPPEYALAAMLGLLTMAAGFALFARGRAAHRPSGALPTAALALAIWLGVFAVHTAVTWGSLAWGTQLTATIAASIALALVVALVPGIRNARLAYRAPIVVGAHALVASATVTSWTLDSLTVVGGLAIVIAIVVLAWAMPGAVRGFYIAIADAVLLIVLARALVLADVDGVIVVALTATAGALIAFAATVVRRMPTGWWYGILIVTLVPFAIGVASVIPGENRSGWQALSTGAIFTLALVLLLTRRDGLTPVVRAMASALLVPALAVVTVSLTSQFLAQSGSPIALPIIAVIIACTVATGHAVRAGLTARGLGDLAARAVRVTIEISSATTAVIAVILALLLPAAGFGTAMVVLLVLGIGAASARVFGGRRYGWWVASAAWTGALWCVWALAKVDVIEPYLLPPALAAVIIGTVVVIRGRDGVALVATGLAAAVAPTIAILAVAGNGESAVVPWRTLGLLAAAAVLLVVGVLVTRRPGRPIPRLAAIRVPLLAVSIGAAGGGAVQAVRIGWELDLLDLPSREWQMLPVLGYSLGAAAVASVAGFALFVGSRWREQHAVGTSQRLGRSRWLLAAALVYVVAGPISAVGPGVVPTWTLWALALVVLALMLITTVRTLSDRTALPPVWFVFAVAWCTAVAGWSVRDLNVEVFSLPLGVALLGAGILALVRPGEAPGSRATPNTWPRGFAGSWWLLAPGIVVTLLPSMIGTATNPATWRAILVLSLAVAGVIVASIVRLASPFLLGLAVLVIENAIVLFALASQGEQISAVQIWIAVGALGVVLLALAVNAERRIAKDGGGGLKMRDLR